MSFFDLFRRKRSARARRPARSRTFYKSPLQKLKGCESDKDCGPLEICHDGECKWFDSIPLATPSTSSRSAGRFRRPGNWWRR